MSFLTDFSPWFILLCVVAGVVYAGFLYFKNQRNGFPGTLLWLLAAMRFVVVTVIGLLLLGPFVQRHNRQLEEPLLIFLQDNSNSLSLGTDSLYNQTEYLKQRQAFITDAAQRFETRSYLFGESFRGADSIDFSDRLTDISSAIQGVEAFYSNRNVGAVILASDGIYNRGLNPVHSALRMSVPVYIMALGDTTRHRDVLVTKINHNRITYLGNKFPVEIIAEAHQSHGLASKLTISHGGKIVFSKEITFSSVHHLETLVVELEALEPGIQRYQVSLSALEGEINLQNNSQDFFIDVIDSRQRVLLLANTPHPDVGALMQSLGDNQNYEVEVSLFENFKGKPGSYNLVILHQLPSDRHAIKDLSQVLLQDNVPVLFILGQQTSLRAFNDLQHGLSIQPRSGELTEALPEDNPAFTVFSIAPEIVEMVKGLPPLFVPFANYQVAAGVQVLFRQRIGALTTDQPMMLFADAGSQKTGVIAGEGIWRWRLHSFARQGSHQGFDELISRIVQYLSLKEDKSQFRVRGPKFLYENDPVVFEAELYNQSYELTNEPEVNLIISDQQDIAFPFIMVRTTNAYRLDAGNFPPGTYSWIGSTNLGNERFTARGEFTVSPLNIEALQTIADHALLQQLAVATGGEMFYPGQWDGLAKSLEKRQDINPVMYSTVEYDELINLKILFLLILLLLSGEWFMRKRSGSY